ncbi:hypothetical protein [Desulfoplanes sp.]
MADIDDLPCMGAERAACHGTAWETGQAGKRTPSSQRPVLVVDYEKNHNIPEQ